MDNKTTILKGVCEMGKYIGIDLGTTFSCMAYINEEGQPVVIPNGEGKNTTPSTVLFDGTSTIVGEEAKNQSIIDPQNFEQFVIWEKGTICFRPKMEKNIRQKLYQQLFLQK